MDRLAPILAASLALSLMPERAAAQEALNPVSPGSDDEDRGPLAPVAEDPAELTPPARLEVIQARRLTHNGQHAEAAALLLALWRELGDPRLLYHAAIARSRAGQHTLALQLLRRYLEVAGPMSAELRAHLDAKIAGETAQLLSVRLLVYEVVAGSQQPVAVGPDARISVEAPDHDPLAATTATPLQVDPGVWMVRVDVPGYLPVAVEQRLEPGPGERSWSVRVERRTVALELRLGPPRALRRAKLRLTASDRAGLPAIELPVAGPRTIVQLTTGAWQLAVSSPRGAAQLTLVVGPTPPPVDLVLRPRSAAADPRLSKHPKLVIGVASAMGVTFYAGLGLAIGGSNLESKANKADAAAFTAAGVEEGGTPDAAALAAIEAEYPTASFHRALRRASDLQTAGAATMMTGLGAVLGILPSLVQSKRRSAYVVIGVGAASLVGGAVWMHDFLRRRDAVFGQTDPEHRATRDPLTGHRLGASMLTGLGIGLAIGGGLTLLTDHLSRRKAGTARFVPLAAPGQAGLLVQGAF